MENVLKIVLSIALIGRSMGEVPVDFDSYTIVEHVPAAVYGPPSPTTPLAPPANEYGAPPNPTATYELAQGNLEYSGQVIEVDTPVDHAPTFTHFLPPNQFGELKKPTVSLNIFVKSKTK